MDNNPVTIIVKAPNQQFEDQTIRCELSWTIKRLKGLLSEVYPSKPVSVFFSFIENIVYYDRSDDDVFFLMTQ